MNSAAALRDRLANEIILLDGGLATTLEDLGADLSSHLWSAALLLNDPDRIADVQRAFIAAGCDVVTTTTYQASHEGFAQLGLRTAETDQLIVGSARAARRVASEADRDVLVVGSVGPYGAILNDGSEYTGNYDLTVEQLRAFHHRRLQLLAPECDIIAFETIPQQREIEAIAAECEGLGVPVWLSVSAAGDSLRSGDSAAGAFTTAGQIPNVVAVGANCIDPRDAMHLVNLAHTITGLPAIVYPNSGETWEHGQWRGTARTLPDVVQWVDAGARMVGGCCRVTPADIATMRALLGRQPTTAPPTS